MAATRPFRVSRVREGQVDRGDVVVVVGNKLQGVFEADFACDFLDEFDFCAGQCAVGRPIRVAAFFAADDGVGDAVSPRTTW